MKNSTRALLKFLAIAVALAIPGLIAASFGNAADEHHSADGGLPTVVILQAINFFMYLALILFFGAKPIANYFKGRQSNFFSALKRADAARAEAQAKRAETQQRLSKLEANRDESIRTARAEAAALRTQVVEEAKSLSSKLKAEAERTAQMEIDRAKVELRDELLKQSVAMAKKILTDKMQDQDQKRLQTEFVEKVSSHKNQAVAT